MTEEIQLLKLLACSWRANEIFAADFWYGDKVYTGNAATCKWCICWYRKFYYVIQRWL